MSSDGGIPSARITSAPSGIRITALRKNVVKPKVSPKPGNGLAATKRWPATFRLLLPRARSGRAAGADPRAAS